MRPISRRAKNGTSEIVTIAHTVKHRSSAAADKRHAVEDGAAAQHANEYPFHGMEGDEDGCERGRLVDDRVDQRQAFETLISSTPRRSA